VPEGRRREKSPLGPPPYGCLTGKISGAPPMISRPNASRQGNPALSGAGFSAGAPNLGLAPWGANQEGADNELCKGQSFADGVFGELGDAPDLQFNHDLLTVGFHGFDADMQAFAD
jgi:hypothetical protein